MPRLSNQHPKSLYKLCLRNITQNMEHVWCKDYIETYCKEKKFYLYVIGPFDLLPSKVLNEIIQILKEEKRLKKHYIELLITQQLAALDLSQESEDVSHSLQLASIRCPHMLKTLLLSGCQKISKHVYQEYLPLLTQLQVLDISNTSAGDSCLFILGAYCKDLRELNLTNCPVTDAGIKGLCVSVDDLGKESDRLGQCKSINKLSISYTKVSERGIRQALENLPCLKVFDCCSTVQTLNQMHRTAFDYQLPDIPKYALIDLHCTDDTLLAQNYETGSLALAVALCPSVIKVRITAQEGMSDDDLLALLDLVNLRELSIGGSDTSAITFDGSIAPILQAVGSSLESLTLAELSGVNIRAVVEFCPNLRFLHLIMNRSYSTVWPEEEKQPLRPKIVKPLPTMKKLESVHLVCVSHMWPSSVIPSEHLPMLLSSPELTYIYIKDCETLTDDLLEKAVKLHQFRNLKHLELEQCKSLTKRGIDLLMTADNPIKAIKLWECAMLTRQHVADWKKNALQNKWALSMDWC